MSEQEICRLSDLLETIGEGCFGEATHASPNRIWWMGQELRPLLQESESLCEQLGVPAVDQLSERRRKLEENQDKIARYLLSLTMSPKEVTEIQEEYGPLATRTGDREKDKERLSLWYTQLAETIEEIRRSYKTSNG